MTTDQERRKAWIQELLDLIDDEDAYTIVVDWFKRNDPLMTDQERITLDDFSTSLDVLAELIAHRVQPNSDQHKLLNELWQDYAGRPAYAPARTTIARALLLIERRRTK